MMWPFGFGFMGWGMLLWGVLGIAFWAGVIFLVIWGVRKFTSSNAAGREQHSALDIARERYAKGEISKEQFEQLKKDLP